jgi:hypothetical protein
MKRRMFLAACLSMLPLSAALAGERKRFVFKIKTKSGGIVGNIVIEAKDIEEAKYKLRKQYPDCECHGGARETAMIFQSALPPSSPTQSN